MIELLSMFLLSMLATLVLAPGFALRLLVKLYPRDDPRRKELIAEMYATKRIERPLFVAEQLETAIFEGVPHRFVQIKKSIVPSTRTARDSKKKKKKKKKKTAKVLSNSALRIERDPEEVRVTNLSRHAVTDLNLDVTLGPGESIIRPNKPMK